VCPAAVPTAGRIVGRHGGLRPQTSVDQVGSEPETQRQEELSEAYLKALAATMEEHREAARLSAVVTEAAQDLPPEAAEVRDEPLVVVAEAAQDVPPEAAEVRDERLAGVPSVAQPSVAQPSVAPQVSLLAARLARQQVTLPLRGPEVPTYEESRSQSLRAGLIEFVSWRPVREKESNNVLSEHFVPNDH
jgi:hypothetical protein